MPSHLHKHRKKIAHVLDVDMGYGHSRAAHALKDLSQGEVITANNYRGIPKAEKTLWTRWRQGYETLSRLRPVPVIGRAAFEIVEKIQEIPEFYPRRDLSKTNLALREAYRLIEKKRLGEHLVAQLNREPLPAICTHPMPAFALEEHGFVGDIWCVPTDTDIARAWAPRDPKGSSIRYLCANGRLMERLRLYGVPENRLFLTGFPLPKSLTGSPASGIVRKTLHTRLCNLDPRRLFWDRYRSTVVSALGGSRCPYTKTHPLTLLYAVGGAGAQREIGRTMLGSLKRKIREKEIRVVLMAGTRPDVARYYERAVHEFDLTGFLGRGVEVIFTKERDEYFNAFNLALQTTDMLWTKPSELVFYAGLGLPIIMAEPLGRQEEFNAIWLTSVGAGVAQGDARFTHEWLFDWLHSGGLARAAWNGFSEAPAYGTYLIEDTILGRPAESMPPPMIV